MLISYIQNILAQHVGGMDRYPLYLVIDNASIHNKDQIIEAFHDNGCQELVDVWFMPPYAAKRLNPLDNSLFHIWKDRVRRDGLLTINNVEQRMADHWNNLTPDQISPHYHHCGLFRDRNPYFDCPLPSQHHH